MQDIGRHEELLARCDIYGSLWHQQTSHVAAMLNRKTSRLQDADTCLLVAAAIGVIRQFQSETDAITEAPQPRVGADYRAHTSWPVREPNCDYVPD